MIKALGPVIWLLVYALLLLLYAAFSMRYGQ
jgi:hypothetical protein